MHPFGDLQLRTGYFGDRGAFLALADLLRETFDIDICRLDRFGGPNLRSMPSGYFDADGRCVANFSAFPMPLVINGRMVRAVGYQSGAVRPAYRGKGLFGDLLRRTFDWSRQQDFEFGLLLTDKPGLYTPYGFRTVPQFAFRGPAPAVRRTDADARSLSLASSGDIDLIMRLLETREPVSTVMAVAGPADFLLNASFDPDIRLSHLPEQDAVIAWTPTEEGFLCLHDVVASSIPSLAEILAGLGVRQQQVVVHFPVDKLSWPGAHVIPRQGSCELMMVRMAETEMPRGPFMLPPTADF
jgi:GNAT superfamily N-acetyltransferase